MVLTMGLMIVVLSMFGVIAAGLCIGFVVTARAPLGYEDETGFHLGQHAGRARNEVAPVLPCGVPVPKPA